MENHQSPRRNLTEPASYQNHRTHQIHQNNQFYRNTCVIPKNHVVRSYVVAAAQLEAGANASLLSRLRLVAGLHCPYISGVLKPRMRFRRVQASWPQPSLVMTCKIDRLSVGENLVTILVSGHITGESVDVLRTLLEQEMATVVIDLKSVLLVDREAVKLLAIQESNGIEIRNCPAYIREWVTREKADTNVSGQRTC